MKEDNNLGAEGVTATRSKESGKHLGIIGGVNGVSGKRTAQCLP